MVKPLIQNSSFSVAKSEKLLSPYVCPLEIHILVHCSEDGIRMWTQMDNHVDLHGTLIVRTISKSTWRSIWTQWWTREHT